MTRTPKTDGGKNRVYEGMPVQNAIDPSGKTQSLENLYAWHNAGSTHGIVTWEWKFGTIVSFDANHSGSTGDIPSVFLNGGEAVYFLQDADGHQYVQFPSGETHDVFKLDGYVVLLLEHRGLPEHR